MKRDYALPPGHALPPPDPWPALAGGDLAVVVPAVAEELSADERLSLDLLARRAGGVDSYLLTPERVRPCLPWAGRFRRVAVPDSAMAGIAAYNRLMMTPWFYRLFAGYRAILIHQLDCLLLRGDSAEWAARGWSYVGAPWFARRGARRLKGVGNGGLSLRRPDHALAVLESDRIRLWPRLAQQRRHFAGAKHLGGLLRTLAAARRAGEDDPRPLAQRFVAAFARPEDEFWGLYAPFFFPGFRIPTPEEALDFAFEARPAEAFALAGGRLPLGCHAWSRMDRAFWTARLAESDRPADPHGEDARLRTRAGHPPPPP